MKKDQFKFTCLASKIALLVVLTSAPVQGATWSSTSSIYPYARVYVGVGYYYDPAVYLRVGQQIGFDATGIVYLLAQVKYGTGTWQTVSNGSAGGLILVTPPWAIRGTYTMEFKLIDELGNTYYHTYAVYVVPSAHLGYIDTIGNRMVMWDDGVRTELSKSVQCCNGNSLSYKRTCISHFVCIRSYGTPHDRISR